MDAAGAMMTALGQQMGPKLESRNDSVDVLNYIIDHAEKTPTGN
jgi:uncharacterized protein (TIGR03435 family)